MQRKASKQKTDRKIGHSSRVLIQDGDSFVAVRKRGPEHSRALSTLEKKFGRGNFTASDVARIGIDRRLLHELARLNHVINSTGNRFSINRDASAHAVAIETPLDLCRTDYSMFAQLPDDSPIKKKLKSVPRPTPEQVKAEAEAILREFEPMHVTKRFKMPYSLYLDLRPDFENLSAYVRYLIYTDRGMKKEAAMEKKRMGDSRKLKRKRAS